MISAREFTERVADRIERPFEEVLPVLREYGLLPAGAPPRPRKLLVTEIAFSGVKTIDGGAIPFEFRWRELGPRLWGIASEANLRGKSTILEVVVWCLRGRPKGLQDAVRAWIRDVALVFEIDGASYCVEFRLKDDAPIGMLSRAAPGAGASIEIARFEGEDEFEHVMDEFMMSTFELSELKSRQRYSHDTLAQTVGSGWVAYSNALHIAGSQPILLGDQFFGGLPGRLLQMFLGVPYAELTMVAIAARGEERQADQQSQRRAELDRGTDQEEIAALERQLEQAKRDRDLTSTVGDLAAEAVSQSEAIGAAVTRRTAAIEATAELGIAAVEAERAADDEAATALHMRHAITAKRYFTGLDPVCCPRCQRPIDSTRKTREINEGACSVCATPREQEEEMTVLAALDEAKQRADEARSAANEARRQHTEALRVLRRVEAEVAGEHGKLAEIEARRAVGDPRHAAELAIARIEGRLEERRSRASARVEVHRTDRALLEAAAREAELLRKQGSEELFAELNREIRTIAERLGIHNIEEVDVALNATMRVIVGGHQTSFSRMTGGERVRLRIATVISILRIGERRGIGRHPGLILIDSPGDEEVVDEDLAEMFRELGRLADELDHLQVFVASAKPAQIEGVIPSQRRRVATGREFLW